MGAFLHTGGPGGPYQDLFETPLCVVPGASGLPPALRGRLGLNGSHAPHPFVLRVAEGAGNLEPGETTAVEVVLIERGIRALPAVAAGFDGFGVQGIGRPVRQRDGVRRGRLRLTGATLQVGRTALDLHDGATWTLPCHSDERLVERVEALWAGPTTEPTPTAAPLAAEFASPLRLRVGHADVTPADFTADVLARAVFRRLAALAVCYAPAPPDEDALRDAEDRLQALAARTRVHSGALRPCVRARYSARQRARVPAGGFFGPFQLTGSPEDLAAWRPLLRRAEVLHLGKGTSQGQGWLRVTPSATPTVSHMP